MLMLQSDVIVTWLLFVGTLLYFAVGVKSDSPSVPDSMGTEFIFSTPFCAESPWSIRVVSQSTEAVNVTVIGPSTSSFLVPPGGAVNTNVSFCTFEWNNVSSSGIGIESTGEISVYVESSDDTFLVFPTDVLGQNYDIVTVTSPEMTSSFFFVSSLNETHLNINFTSNMSSQFVTFRGQRYSSGASVEVFLSAKYETLAISCHCDLTGTVITSSHPVIVITGAFGAGSGHHVIEQVLPTSMWGRKFLFPSHNWFSEKMTLKLSGESRYTSVRLYLKDRTETLFLNAPTVISKQLTVTDFVAIHANSSVLCSLLFNVSDVNGNWHPTLVTLTPHALFHPVLHFVMINDTRDEVSLNMVLRKQSHDYVTLNQSSDESPFDRPMTSMWSLFFLQNLKLLHPYGVSVDSSNMFGVSGLVVRRNDSTAHVYSLGMRATDIYTGCSKTPRAHGGNGDGIDNDCDGMIDEETLNSVDDDLDGSSDEDTHYYGTIESTSGKRSFWDLYKDEEEDKLSGSVISVIISITVALFAVACFISGMLLAEKLREKMYSGTVQPLNG